jgi:membrane protease YdiL (CAAX protease family)
MKYELMKIRGVNMENLYFENVNKGKNNWWRYLITIILPWVGGTIAIIPVMLISSFFDSSTISKEVITQLSLLFQFTLSTCILLILLKLVHKRDIMGLINRFDKLSKIKWFKRIKWLNLLKGVIIGLSLLLFNIILSYLIIPDSIYWNSNFNWITTLPLILVIIPIQITFEELFFRGYLNQGLSLKIRNPITIILISSLIFAIAHILTGTLTTLSVTLTIVITFLMGIILSLFALVYNGIEVAIGIHLINNIFSFVILGS